MAKILVSCDHALTDEKRAALVKRVADELGVLAEDVVFVPYGVSVSVIDVPADLKQKAKEQEKPKEAAASPTHTTRTAHAKGRD